jgi:sulfite exporter TauE/SafE/copper chaperone CopZ
MEIQTKKSEFFVEGMHCASCELLIESKLSEVEGIKRVDAKLNKRKVYIESESELSAHKLSDLVEEYGYKIVETRNLSKAVNWKETQIAALLATLIVGLFILIQKLGIVDLVNAEEVTLPFVFMIGIVASLSTCMAVVGGLVLSISSSYAKSKSKVAPLLAFHLSRVTGFFILGGIMGLIGSAFILGSKSTFIINLILFLVMLIMGLNLLDINPKFRNLQIKMPKALGKNVLKLENKNNFMTPIVLGLVTFVLPCGFTQSMQLYSLTTGNFIEGAITMLVFALGTLPVLALISFASVKFSKTFQSGIFFKTAGFIVLFFALFNFSTALVAIGWIDPIFNI